MMAFTDAYKDRNHKGPAVRRAFASLILLVFCQTAVAADTNPALPAEDPIPHVGKTAQQQYSTQYPYAGKHKAFAIAPGGAWGWVADALSQEQAKREALENCQAHTQQKCILYDVNERQVFDAGHWTTLWGPYASDEQAARAKTGTRVGMRFPDIRWRESDTHTSISQLQGSVVILHFWGSWCPPCLREFPSLQEAHTILQENFAGQLQMRLLQVREPFAQALEWARDNDFADLPLRDSGNNGDTDSHFYLADDSTLSDRSIARAFPTTYILDRNGLVIFSHYGPIHDWSEYVDFIAHAVNMTGNSTLDGTTP